MAFQPQPQVSTNMGQNNELYAQVVVIYGSYGHLWVFVVFLICLMLRLSGMFPG